MVPFKRHGGPRAREWSVATWETIEGAVCKSGGKIQGAVPRKKSYMHEDGVV